MKYDIEVTIYLKEGMLNPEAKTIENSLSLLGYNVSDTKTKSIITFQMEGENTEEVKSEVDDMCQRLLCNPVIHNYKILVFPKSVDCGLKE
ncbi:phosphoribosylformylglycinamidine synthase subunit PurS [Methanobrevibacter boviskoreani]|uniref:phosphoribosylformylglycinamidine synthase subunit PurS n=1 Tax=Methanobrevibacter boviskoreani TaxID=1348249 RepID=UPI0023EF85D3|nr:phosphoribosylformylglycinamidine synthase subunit PurS [Methanobrevibacter boviskoreani]MDD6257292.1 phosphoribosylformylglycinamidine synthase subunit PurS [Methanobrevibacter boviskoreani]